MILETPYGFHKRFYDTDKFNEVWGPTYAAYKAGHLTIREAFAQGKVYLHAAYTRPEGNDG